MVRRIAMKFGMTHFDPLKPSDVDKNLTLKNKMTDGRCLDKSAVDILKATQQGQNRYGADANRGAYWRHLVNTIEPHVALSNYFDYLDRCAS